MKRKPKEVDVELPTGRPGKIVQITLDVPVLNYYTRVATLAAITTDEAMRVVLAMQVVNAALAAKDMQP